MLPRNGCFCFTPDEQQPVDCLYSCSCDPSRQRGTLGDLWICSSSKELYLQLVIYKLFTLACHVAFHCAHLLFIPSTSQLRVPFAVALRPQPTDDHYGMHCESFVSAGTTTVTHTHWREEKSSVHWLPFFFFFLTDNCDSTHKK